MDKRRIYETEGRSLVHEKFAPILIEVMSGLIKNRGPIIELKNDGNVRVSIDIFLVKIEK